MDTHTDSKSIFNKEQREKLTEQFADLPVAVKFVVKGIHGEEATKEMSDFVRAFAKLAPGFSVKVENAPTEQNAPVVELWVDGDPAGVSFCGVPSGKELESFTKAVLNAGGKGDNMPDDMLRERIEKLEGPAFLFTFVSKGCPGCPDVVEAMNVVSLINHRFKNMTVDIDAAPEFAKEYDVKSVPAVFANGELLSLGHASLGQLVADLEKRYGSSDMAGLDDHSALGFDAIVAGAGPAGVAAAIYLARKGLRTAVVEGKVGGQVTDTVAIENLIPVPRTTGSDLTEALRNHLKEYDITLFENRKIVESDLQGKGKRIKTDIGEWFKAPALVIATGASWRKLNIPGEDKFMGKGVALCAHCDGPFYKGKKVAVVGGGNSGVEAAIDLAGICSHVDLFEVSDKLNADEVLCKRLESFDNVDVHLSSQLTEILGNSTSGVTSIKVKEAKTDSKNDGIVDMKTASQKDGATDVTAYEEKDYRVDGVFIQIGLVPNSQPFEGEVNINERGEIITDALGHTDIFGVYAAGDVTDIPYKQIVVAIGEGAKAALTAVNDRIRDSF